MMIIIITANTYHYVSVTVLSILHITSHFIFTTHEVGIIMMPILQIKKGDTEMLTHIMHKNTH